MARNTYAEKRARGEMMYGPGCCAHGVSKEAIEKAKEAAKQRGHFAPQRLRSKDGDIIIEES